MTLALSSSESRAGSSRSPGRKIPLPQLLLDARHRRARRCRDGSSLRCPHAAALSANPGCRTNSATSSSWSGRKASMRRDPFGHLVLQQDRGALAFVIAKVGAVLGVADQRRELGREVPRDRRRISEPLVLIGLEPAKAVADDRAPADLAAGIAAGAMKRRTRGTGAPSRARARPRIAPEGSGSSARSRRGFRARSSVAPFSRV